MTQELKATVEYIEKMDLRKLAAWIGEPSRSAQAMINRVRKQRDTARQVRK